MINGVAFIMLPKRVPSKGNQEYEQNVIFLQVFLPGVL